MFLITAVAALLAIMISPIGKPTVTMVIESTEPGFSQLFVADEAGAFAEERSGWQPIQRGMNTIRFPIDPLRGTLEDQLRWDPSDAPGSMVVNSIQLRSGLRQVDIPLSALLPSLGMSAITAVPGGVSFTLESNDPSALLSADVQGFYTENALAAILIALLVAGVVTFAVIQVWHRRSVAASKTDDTPIDATTQPAPVSTVAALKVPGWAVMVGALSTLACMVMILWGSQVTGVSWDERDGTMFLAEYLRSGWFLDRSLFVDGVPDAAHAAVYAPVASLFGHVTSVALGAEPWLQPAFTSTAYAARHLSVGLIALAGLSAIFISGRILFRSTRWGIIATGTLASIPLWVGHSMFNFKDIPPASGFAIFTLGMILQSSQNPSPRMRLGSGLLLAGGVFLAVGSRPGIWIALTLVLALSLALWLVMDLRTGMPKQAWSNLTPRLWVSMFGVIVGYAALWVIYPTLFGDLGRATLGSATSSADFPLAALTLTAGSEMPSPPPWTYIPLWLGAQLPLFVALFASIGVIALAASVAMNFLRATPPSESTRGLVPVALQALVIPIGVTVLSSNIFGGIRHLLFIFPAIALLAVAGVAATIRFAKERRLKAAEPITWGIVVVGFTVTLIAQVQLFPFNFAYFNPVAATKSIDGNWDVDGWWLSGRELASQVDMAARIVCAESPSRPVVDCDQLGVLQPFLEETHTGDARAIELPPLKPTEYVLLSRFPTPLSNDLCTRLAEVERPLFWQRVTLSHVDVCQASVTPYPPAGIDFAGIDRSDPRLAWGWDPYLLWGWGEPVAEGVWSAEPSASVGLRLSSPTTSASTTPTLIVTGTRMVPDGETRDLEVLANGTQVGRVQFTPDAMTQEFLVPLPPDLTAAGEYEVIIEFRTPEMPSMIAAGGDDELSRPGFRLDRLALR